MSARMSARRASLICSGSDEVGRAQHLTLVRQPPVGRPLALDLGQPEVEDLDHGAVALAGEHQVARLDVAVDHAVLVGVLQAQRRLVHVVAGLGHRQRPAGLDQLRQVESLDVLHRQDEALADAEGRVGRDDVGMMQLGRVADFGEEAIEPRRGG